MGTNEAIIIAMAMGLSDIYNPKEGYYSAGYLRF
jgi:hypothetical protein